MRVFAPDDLLRRLDDRFRLLTAGTRTALPRQQTLRTVIDWSYDLLFDDERRVFERLSLFAGRFGMSAAEAVCADETIDKDEVAELLARLVDKSLVTTSHATVRSSSGCSRRSRNTAVNASIAPPDADATRARHAKYVAS